MLRSSVASRPRTRCCICHHPTCPPHVPPPQGEAAKEAEAAAKGQVAELRRRVAQLREQERALYAEVSGVLQEADAAQAEVSPTT